MEVGGLIFTHPAPPVGRGYLYLLLGSLALVPPAMEVRTISPLLQPWNVLFLQCELRREVLGERSQASEKVVVGLPRQGGSLESGFPSQG